MRKISSIVTLILIAATCEASTFSQSLRCQLTLSTSKRLLRSQAAQEAYEGDLIDGHIPGEYNYFSAGLGHQTVESYARVRRQAGFKVHVCDLFGSAVFSDEPEVFDSLTGVRLQPLLSSRIPDNIKVHQNWRELVGNIYSRNTWNILDQSMDSRGISKFDIIFIKPEGALRTAANLAFDESVLPLKINLLDNNGNPLNVIARSEIPTRETRQSVFLASSLLLVERAWKRLSNQNGLLLTQITNEMMSDKDFQDWVNLMRLRGQRIDFFAGNRSTPYMRLFKTQVSPATIVH